MNYDQPEKQYYNISSFTSFCPTQAEGHLEDGRPYYFRARGGVWSLRISRHRGPADFLLWEDDNPLEEVFASGEDDTGGAMTREQVIEILDKYMVPGRVWTFE